MQTGEIPSRWIAKAQAVNKLRRNKPKSTPSIANKPNEKKLNENAEQASLIRQRRSAENQIRWSNYLKIVNTDEFKRWYRDNSGDAWPERFTQFPDDGYRAVQRLVEQIESAKNQEIARREYYSSQGFNPDATSWQRRYARQQMATPPWVDWIEIQKLEEKRKEYNDIYPDEAPFHIDHVIPLQGKLVCGLHVHTNMQVISRTENIMKSNKFYCG